MALVKSILSRTITMFIFGIVSSLPICTLYITSNFNDAAILFSSLIIFLVLSGIDSFIFSRMFWKWADFFFGQLLPYGIYAMFSAIAYKSFSAIIFSHIYLPMRVLEVMELRTIYSVAIMHFCLVVFIFFLRTLGGHIGRGLAKEAKRQTEEAHSETVI